MTPDWVGAFVIGLLGAGHCMGMCGGISTLLTLNQQQSSAWPVLIFYNSGRIFGYMMIGAIIGALVASITELSSLNQGLVWLRLIASIFMIILGLYVGRWWFGLLKIEKFGQGLWQYLAPAGKKLLPLKRAWHALPFGFIWGWLPCGLVYSMLTWSAVAGGALQGSAIMGAFGLGTLPAMLLTGFGAGKLQQLQKSSLFRSFSALLIIGYGIYTLYSSVALLHSGI